MSIACAVAIWFDPASADAFALDSEADDNQSDERDQAARLAARFRETVQHRLSIEWRGPLTPPAILFIAAGAVSVLVSGDHRGALGLYRAYFLEPAAFFLVVGAVASTPRRAGLILLGFGVGGAVADAVGVRVRGLPLTREQVARAIEES